MPQNMNEQAVKLFVEKLITISPALSGMSVEHGVLLLSATCNLDVRFAYQCDDCNGRHSVPVTHHVDEMVGWECEDCGGQCWPVSSIDAKTMNCQLSPGLRAEAQKDLVG